MITTVFLDLDETIFDFKKAQVAALKRAFGHFDIEASEELLNRYDELNKYVWQLLEDGKAGREEILVLRFQMLFEEFGIEKDPDPVQELYEKELGVGHIYLPGAEKFLGKLHGKCRMYLVSNGSAAVQESRIGSSDLAQYLDGIFISEEVGADKPSMTFFDRCFSKIPPFSKEAAVIIGDSLTSDIRGGIGAGLHTIWFNHRNQPAREDIVPEYEAKSYEEILSIIEAM